MNGDRTAVIDRVRRKLADGRTEADVAQIAQLIREETQGLVSDRELLELLKLTQAEVAGAGPLDGLLQDDTVTDVLVNGPADIWADRGAGLERMSVDLGTNLDVLRLAQRLAARAGRRLDAASPWVDATLPNGARLHAVIPPIAHGCALISIRTLRQRHLTLLGLVDSGSMCAEIADLLVAIVDAQLSFLISGGTGSGKTTLLSVLLGLVPHRERILVVEDADELRPEHPQVVKLLSRPPNIEGAGEIALRSLVRQALRMRPDRIIVGEVRGAEIAELLMALNTGHRGGAGTIHANGVHDVPSRICALGAVAGLSLEAVRAQASSAIDVLIHVGRRPDGARHVAQIAIVDGRADEFTVSTVWSDRGGFTQSVDRFDDLLKGGKS